MEYEHLAQAERHVREGVAHVQRQRHLAVELERKGHDASTAWRLLNQFEELLALHIQGRDRIMAELKKIEAA